jgi:hypothetical protein
MDGMVTKIKWHKEMEKYLRWRFMSEPYIRNKYGRYCEEWIKNVTEDQLAYFREERERLTLRGIYKEE